LDFKLQSVFNTIKLTHFCLLFDSDKLACFKLNQYFITEKLNKALRKTDVSSSFIPPDNGDVRWQEGSETFTREESKLKDENNERKRYKMKQTILDVISDLCSDFFYYDRKEDEQLTIEQLNEAVKSGKITIDEMVSEFRRHLENTFN
jgi:translation elongation factor EF-G